MKKKSIDLLDVAELISKTLLSIDKSLIRMAEVLAKVEKSIEEDRMLEGRPRDVTLEEESRFFQLIKQ